MHSNFDVLFIYDEERFMLFENKRKRKRNDTTNKTSVA